VDRAAVLRDDAPSAGQADAAAAYLAATLLAR
jgi:hypothetical protein